MTTLVFHHDHKELPLASDDVLPVQLYGLSGKERGDVSYIGNTIIDKVQRLGVQIPSQVMDFLTISLAVTAADTFVQRGGSDDGWCRQLTLQLPLHSPNRWIAIKPKLEKAMHFLSGDMWNFEFLDGGFPPPTPYSPTSRYGMVNLQNIDSVCLFSGGLDSAIGAIDLLAKGRAPLLVSHAYKGDKSYQDCISDQLAGQYSRFEINADPHHFKGETDITMRTRSLNFLAFAAVGAYAVKHMSGQRQVDLYVPENGFISLNAPLTTRRIGALSTRTTHPHFLASIQQIFGLTEIPCRIVNPYQFMTKGQMVSNCSDRPLLQQIVDSTVSCSHWKRKNQQCGICVPCIIRRASLHSGKINETPDYEVAAIADVLRETNRRDDLLALRIAVEQKGSRKLGPWVMNSGPLPRDRFHDFEKVFLEGLNEVEGFLQAEGAL